jgi:hypothetical protein
MSLINDALKKAARQRAEEQGEVAPMPGGGRRPSRQGGPMQKQTFVLIIGAAVVLVVVSAVVTGILMNGKPEAKAPAAARPAPDLAATDGAQKVVVQAPVVAISLAPTAAPTPVVVAKPSPTPPPVAAEPTALPVVALAPTAVPAAPSPQPQRVADNSQGHIDTVQAIVDAFHISGVRTAGAGSKALVNGHIYKLNDVVDKAIGLKLVKVDEDHLTFVDRDGNTFVRNF